jgi:hypothetical protein
VSAQVLDHGVKPGKLLAYLCLQSLVGRRGELFDHQLGRLGLELWRGGDLDLLAGTKSEESAATNLARAENHRAATQVASNL